MNNNKQETWVNIYNTVNGFIVSKPYPTQTLALTKDEVPEGATYITTIPSSTEEIIQWDEYGNPKPIINGGDNMNNNPGTSINMDDLRSCISLYLDDVEHYGRVGEHEEAINVLNDFVEYIDSMNGRGATPITEKQWLDGEQAMIDYNAMEEESEMDNYNEMNNEQR